jgi:outer membrane protein, multidrug efflux system
MKKFPVLLLLGMALLPAGCALTPKYARPEAPVPAEWPGDAVSRETGFAANAPGASELEWQKFFTDEKLRQVIGTALTNNRDLRLAVLNVERARALYGIQRAELLPTVDAVGSGSRQRLPADLSSSGEGTTSERYDVNLGLASWEVDLFGRIRSLKARALEQYLATEQARRGAQILLVSSVARAYLTLAANQERLNLSESTLSAQRGSYDLISRSAELGLVPATDLHRSRSQVESTRRDVALLAQVVAQDKNALNLLAGAPVPAGLLPTALDSVSPPGDVSAGVPSDELLRRPDVLQAESLLRAANADIGAARAAFFPRISLTAALGSASRELSGLFDSGSGAWTFAPRATLPVFDARLWSAHKAAKVQREIAVTQYEKAIQTAFAEVADTLAVRASVGEQVAAQEALVHAAAQTYELSLARYAKGVDSYLNVFDAQRSLYAARQVLVSLRLVKAVNRTQLYAVLGGGAAPLAARPEEAPGP